MSHEDILKLALPPLITFLVGLFLPETLRLDLRSTLTYFLYGKTKFQRYLSRCRQTPGHKYAFCGFYQVDPEGRLLPSGPGISLTRNLVERMQLTLEENSTARDYSKIWPFFKLNVYNVTLPNYALYIKRINKLQEYMQHGIGDTFLLWAWGTVDQGKLQQFHFHVRDGIFYPRFKKDLIQLSEMALKVSQRVPNHIFSEYISYLLIGLYQQGPVTVVGITEGRTTEAHLLLDDGFCLIKRGIDLVRDADEAGKLTDDHSRFFYPEYHALKGLLYEKDNSFFKALEEYGNALEFNLYHPYKTEVEFKRHYFRNYARELVQNTAVLKDEVLKDGVLDLEAITANLSLYDETYQRPLLDYVLRLVLRQDGDDYYRSLKIFEDLNRKFPNSSLPLIYWGEALKLYKSEPFNLNPANLDPALEKYKSAEQVDPTWEIIKVKISTIYLFKKGYGQGGDETEAQLKHYLFKAKEFYEHPELKKFLTSLGKSEKKTTI